MIFGSKGKLKKLSKFELKITGEILKRTDTYKYLGVHFDPLLIHFLRPKQGSYW